MREFLTALQEKLGFGKLPAIDSLDKYIEYTDRQAAFVSQVSLYTYIKTRAGTQWPKLFEDEVYLVSMKIARWHIFGASVIDLGVYLGALLVVKGGATPAQAEAISSQVIRKILTDYNQDDLPAKTFNQMIKDGLARCTNTDWHAMAEGPAAFQSSADALISWTPIADELKDLDEEIVRNSIHMRWINVRRDIKDTLVPEAIIYA